MRDDAELLRRYVEFHSDADFTELVGRYLGLVYQAALRRTGGRADLAEEVAQSVFTVMASKAAGLIEHHVLAAWLYTTTKHTANSLLRAERRRHARDHEAHMIDDATAADPAPEWEHIRRELDGVMDQLPQRDREAVLLRFFHGQAFAQIGAAVGLSEEAARKRVDRALDRLRERLSRRGITSTAAALGLMLSSQAAIAAPTGLTQSIATAALAHAAGASLPAMGALHIMSTKTTLSLAGVLGLAGILGIPAIGIAVYQMREAHRTTAAVTVARQEYETRATLLKQLQQNAQAADQRVAEIQTDLDQLRATAAAKSREANKSKTPAPAGKPASDENADGSKFIATFGQSRAMLTEVGKAQLRRSLAGFYRSAGLNPAQIDEIETRTAAYWLENVAVTPNSIHPTVNFLPDDQMRQLLGDEGLQRFQDFKRSGPAYGIATQVSLAVGYTAPALSAEQSNQLVEAVRSNSSAYQSGQKLDMGAVDWNAVIAQTKTSLSPAQWQAAEGVFLNLQFQQAVNRAQKETTAAAAKPKS